MMPQNFRNKIINFSFILFLLIPISLISGPFIPDFFLVIIVINFIVLICFKDEYKIINNKVLFLFLLFYFTVAVVSIFSLNISSIQSRELFN